MNVKVGDVYEMKTGEVVRVESIKDGLISMKVIKGYTKKVIPKSKGELFIEGDENYVEGFFRVAGAKKLEQW